MFLSIEIFKRKLTSFQSLRKQGKLKSVQYIVEQCHANVETKDNKGWTPLSNASIEGHLDVVKYLYEACHSEITEETIILAKTQETKEYLLSKLHAKS